MFNFLGNSYDTSEVQIDFNNPDLDKMLSDMYEISCVETIRAYHRENRVDCEEEISEIRKIKEDVLKIIKEKIFESRLGGNIKAIYYEDLFKLFNDYYSEGVIFFYFLIFILFFILFTNKKFLSSEYFRRITFSCLVKETSKNSRICCYY